MTFRTGSLHFVINILIWAEKKLFKNKSRMLSIGSCSHPLSLLSSVYNNSAYFFPTRSLLMNFVFADIPAKSTSHSYSSDKWVIFPRLVQAGMLLRATSFIRPHALLPDILVWVGVKLFNNSCRMLNIGSCSHPWDSVIRCHYSNNFWRRDTVSHPCCQ